MLRLKLKTIVTALCAAYGLQGLFKKTSTIPRLLHGNKYHLWYFLSVYLSIQCDRYGYVNAMYIFSMGFSAR
jgi:uncharacterized membrane protein (UPF0136 family)